MACEKPNVLVVDDDASAREGLARLLRVEGFDVDTAADGSAALELAARSTPDIVVTDLRMPGMGGLEMLEALRARGFELPIIVATACDEVALAVAAIRAGATEYLTKPINADLLLIAIDRSLATRDLRRKAAAVRARKEDLALEVERNLLAREALLPIAARAVRGPLGVVTLTADPSATTERQSTSRSSAHHPKGDD